MTIRDALAQRVPRVRQSNWVNPAAYLRLPLLADGAGPWAELYDDEIQVDVLRIRPGSQRVLCALRDTLDQDGYDIYAGPMSSFESHAENFAQTYVEG